MGPNYYAGQYGGQYITPEYYAQMQNQLQQQQAQLQQMQQSQQKTVIDFVQGEASADVFPVSNGQKVILFDIDNPFLYQKERDASGTLSKKKFRLIEEKDPEPENVEPIDLSKYVKIDDLEKLVSEVVTAKLSEYTNKSTKKKTVVEEE